MAVITLVREAEQQIKATVLLLTPVEDFQLHLYVRLSESRGGTRPAQLSHYLWVSVWADDAIPALMKYLLDTAKNSYFAEWPEVFVFVKEIHVKPANSLP